jgi:hypothetical protein
VHRNLGTARGFNDGLNRVNAIYGRLPAQRLGLNGATRGERDFVGDDKR